jgi:hypothetical protein
MGTKRVKMKPILCSDFLKVALVGVVGVIISNLVMAADNSSAPIKSMDLTLPVLTVSQGNDGKWSGKLIELELTVSRKSDNLPLLVAIAEDRPSGVGEQFRAAMWSAASTVALERGDPLRGCRIELTAQDAIDGPSAGAMTTFGIMSALDERPMTNDFVFTGTILPNGSVGYVGGLVQKIQAAKAAGKKRVLVPAYLRTQKDLNTGETVDLKEECQSLNLQFIPVANIRQAYALISNAKEQPNESPNLNLPDKVENVYSKLYRRELKDAESQYERLSSEEKESVTNVSILKEFCLNPPAKAESAYQAGNLPSAYDIITDCAAIIEGFSAMRHYIMDNNLTNVSINQYIARFDQEISKQNEQQLASFTNYLQTASPSNAAAAQFDDMYNEVSTWCALNDFFDAIVSRDLTNAVDAQDEKQKDAFSSNAKDVKCWQLTIAYAWGKSRSVEDVGSFASLFNEKKTVADGRHRAIERLLFYTMEATFSSFKANTLNQVAEDENITPNAIESYLESTDIDYLQCMRSRQTSELFRQGFKDDATLYSLVSLSRSHAHALAEITAQTIKEDLDSKQNDAGTVRYGNTILLQAMLQSAREEALNAIEHCQKQDVICWGPVAAIHIADAKRDDPDIDKVDVFEEYLEAALDAKILTLMLSKNAVNQALN